MRLGLLIAVWRHQSRKGLREMAKEIGVSAATLSRFENGKNIDGETLHKLLLWIMTKV